MSSRAAVRRSIRRWSSLPTAGFLAAGVAAGLAAWAVDLRAALSLLVGFGATGGLLVFTWLRARLRAMYAETTRLRSSQQELLQELQQQLQQLQQAQQVTQQRLRQSEERLLTAHGMTEQQVRLEVAAAEQRLRSANSGDLVALEKRLRDLPPQSEVEG